ncbi:hypothetical protein SAMN05444671_1962 [Flavobacterium sp. CF108]|uniref:hypothetical protein n=1 Tax=unclassified Flavobacterium TaxID=196869 RepID=UPI0008CBB0AB|nr:MULTISPECIES: hypothetical protein [unclassified Flavobacterium]SEN62179.1 hypothetical protein SAMN04487978_1278 [Flavobacterium sp. fv08]SHH04342.1 hypothetical protein SAMN05444671_1962 [Flavobacterium sp. CF108]
MKTYLLHFAALAGLFSISGFAQQTNYMVANADSRRAPYKFDSKPTDDRVIESYLVVEVINMPFGKRTTKYEVSKLDMVYTNDLGPNNTRTVTPIYKKTKVRTESTILPSKTIADAVAEKIKPVEVEVTAPAYSEKFVKIDILDTYANVLDKGYESIDMLKKVADKYYFESNFEDAVKYYTELFTLDANLGTIYYFRYAQCLKATNENEKGEEMMKLFESKNLNQ